MTMHRSMPRRSRRPTGPRAGRVSRRAALAASLVIPLTLAAWSTSAADGEARRGLRYQIEVAGVQVGRVEVAAAAGREAADARVRFRIDGLLGLMDRERGELEARGRVDRDGRVVPAAFTSLFEKSDRRREVSIRYGRDGEVSELELRRDGRPRGTDVPEDLREGTVDTLTAFWRLREWLGDDRDEGRVAVFDGRRRYDLLATRLGREAAELDGREVRAERVELTLVPRAGFDEDEKVFGNRIDPDEPWAELLVATDDGDGVPLSLTGRGRMKWRIVLDGEG